MIFDWILKKEYDKVLSAVAADAKLLSVRDKSGNTPLHYAIEHGYGEYDELAKELIGMSDDLDLKGVDGFTPLHHAVSMNKGEIIKLLIAAGADVNAKDTYGNSALQNAVFRYIDDPIAIRLLIESKADPHTDNKYGVGISKLLTMPKNQDIAEELRAYMDSYKK